MVRLIKYLPVALFFVLIGISDAQVGPWDPILPQDYPQLIIWLNSSNLGTILNINPAIVQQILFGYQYKAFFGINYDMLTMVKLGKKLQKMCRITANRPDKGKLQVTSAECYDCVPSKSCSSSKSKHKHKEFELKVKKHL